MLRIVSLRLNLPKVEVTKVLPAAFQRLFSTTPAVHNEDNELPKLEIPVIQHTLKKFVSFARPLQNDPDYQRTIDLTNDFVHSSDCEAIQGLLEERAQKLPNWLTPWWLEEAYLKDRASLAGGSSPGFIFPKWNYSGLDGQIHTAAKLIQAAVQFYLNIINNDLPPEKIGRSFLDMNQYKNIFGTTRIPAHGKDKLAYGKDCKTRPDHIIVIRNGHIFRVPVFDFNGDMLNVDQLVEELKENVIKLSTEMDQYPVGMLTCEERGAWADIYARLKETNGDRLQVIEESLFAVCLDNEMVNEVGYNEYDIQASQCLHGGGTHNNSNNRWFDKTLQFIVGIDGRCGLILEHSPADGPPVAALADYICDQITADNFVRARANGQFKSSSILSFSKTEEDKGAINNVKKKFDRYVSDLELRVHVFEHFGKERPKEYLVSPDSFIQLALQLTYYRIHRKFGRTYETGSLRKFLDGRTETIRLPNFQTAMFVLEMVDSVDEVSKRMLGEMLRVAAGQHKKYTALAMDGQAMDRHLLGIRLISEAHGIRIPSFLQTDIYKKMMHFTLSTSQVPTKNRIPLTFSPSAPDCYGICYNPQNKNLLISVSTFKSCEETSSVRFINELEKSLLDMSDLLRDADQEAKQQAAKKKPLDF